ncbi:MAG: glycosyltransferase family 39 protein [Halioglobus sp.]
MQYFFGPERRKEYTIAMLLSIVCVGFLLRFNYNSVTLLDNPIRGDAAYYFVYAQNLLEHSTFSKDRVNNPPIPDSFWSPGFPMFLAGVLAIADKLESNIYQTLLNFQLGLALCTIVLTFVLASMAMNRCYALVTAALVALSPHLVSMGAYALTETLACTLLLLALTLLAKGTHSKKAATLTSSGICFGLLFLVNPVTIFTAPLALGVLVLHTRNDDAQSVSWPTCRKVVLVILPMMILAGSWTLRSQINVPEGQPSSSSRLMMNLTAGLHSDYHARWRANPRDPNNPATLDARRIKGSYAEFGSVFWERLREDPTELTSWYVFGKPRLLWDWNIRIGQGDIYVYPVLYSLYHVSKPAIASYTLTKSIHPWLLGCALLSGLFIWRNRKSENGVIAAVYLSTVYISAIYVVTQAEPRYSIPLRPEMYMCAMYFVFRLQQLISKSRRPH